jgi:FAD binding domain
MVSQLIFASVITTLLILSSILIMRCLRPPQVLEDAKKSDHPDLTSTTREPNTLSRNLASALPGSVIFPHDTAAFKPLINSYWAQQECEVIPACVVRPRNVQQLCTTVTILKREYDKRGKQAGEQKAEGLFAVRGGGHSPNSGAASIKGGAMIDLGFFNEVTPSGDGSSVVIGAGAKWMDVSKVLDEKGLAVVGGRNSAVGVGGLTLGGKTLLIMSIFTLVALFHSESTPGTPFRSSTVPLF